MTTLDDILAAIDRNTAAIRATTDQIVGTAEAARRLNVGRDQLAAMVADGRLKRIAHMRGIGNGYCYHVDEIARCAEQLAAQEVDG